MSSRQIPLGYTRDSLTAAVIAHVFNRIAGEQRLDHQLQALNGRRIAVRVTAPIPATLAFQVRDGRVRARSGAPPDVCISGRLSEIVRLAARLEDADTLFFQRRLRLEGDTETGVHVRNLLDALELDPAALVEAHLAKRLAAMFSPPLSAVHDLVLRAAPAALRWLDRLGNTAPGTERHGVRSAHAIPGRPRQ